VACGNDDIIKGKQETGVDAIVSTNEMASQCAAAKREQKDQMCSTKVNTETQACQKDTVGDSKEVSCMILKPEEINKVVNREECISNDEDLPECYKCDGKKVNKNGLPCKKCNGTGKLNNKFFKDL